MKIKMFNCLLNLFKPKVKPNGSLELKHQTWMEVSELLSTVFYIDGVRVGLVVKIEDCPNYNFIIITVDPMIDEFIETIDLASVGEGFIKKHQIYKSSKCKENWIVDELPTASSSRFLSIKVNPNFS